MDVDHNVDVTQISMITFDDMLRVNIQRQNTDGRKTQRKRNTTIIDYGCCNVQEELQR